VVKRHENITTTTIPVNVGEHRFSRIQWVLGLVSFVHLSR